MLIPALLLSSLNGCSKPQAETGIKDKPEVINANIGSIAHIIQSGVIEVRGFGIVAGLNGTGSSECPEELRKKLMTQIKVEMQDLNSINPRAFINSKNTAVVEVRGLIPPIASKGDMFDLRVAPLANTQTTSLEGGRLYTTTMVKQEKFVVFGRHLQTQAIARGPIFINKLSDRNPNSKEDFIISGGKAVEGINIIMLLEKPNYYTARLITDLINDKFDIGTADGVGPGEIHINIPNKYHHEKQKFLAMIRAIYLGNNPRLHQERLNSLIRDLVTNEDKLSPEIALEVTGNSALSKLAPLLSHPDEKVRFHASRCMLNIGDDRSLKTLRKIIENQNSPFRIEAIKAVGRGARRNEAITILSNSLSDKDFEINLAVYEELRKLRGINVTRSVVAGDFYLDTVRHRGKNCIYVSRKGTPKIVIFGEGLECAKNMFVKSSNDDITINARYGDKFVSIWRNNPKKHGIIGPLKSTYKVTDVIKTLGELPKVPIELKKLPGLAIPYYEICALLEKMCKTGVIDAEFIAGDLPEFANAKPADSTPTIPGFESGPGTGSITPPVKDKEQADPDAWKKLIEGKNIQENKPETELGPDNTDDWKTLLEEEKPKRRIKKQEDLENTDSWKRLLED